VAVYDESDRDYFYVDFEKYTNFSTTTPLPLLLDYEHINQNDWQQMGRTFFNQFCFNFFVQERKKDDIHEKDEYDDILNLTSPTTDNNNDFSYPEKSWHNEEDDETLAKKIYAVTICSIEDPTDVYSMVIKDSDNLCYVDGDDTLIIFTSKFFYVFQAKDNSKVEKEEISVRQSMMSPIEEMYFFSYAKKKVCDELLSA